MEAVWIIAQGTPNQQSHPKIVNLDSFDFVAVQEGYALDRSRWYVIARHMMPNGVAEIPLTSCRTAADANATVQRIGAAMNQGLTLLDLASEELAEKPAAFPPTTKDLAIFTRR